jgi:putative ATP-dependent endonuclease of OLD family
VLDRRLKADPTAPPALRVPRISPRNHAPAGLMRHAGRVTPAAQVTAGQPTSATSVAGLRVDIFRCTAFRGIDSFEISLDPKLTVLVGRNNSGKSRILRALAIATGAVRADRDDLTAGRSGEATIDLIIAPSGGNGTFDAALSGTIGPDIRRTIAEDPFEERLAWRTTIGTSSEGFGATSVRRLLRWDNVNSDWRPTGRELPRAVLQLLEGYLIDARRDLAAELRQRGSAAYRLIDDLELDPDVAPDLQRQLDKLSAAIVAGSGTLQSVKRALQDLSSRVDAIGEPAIRPFPGRVDDLSTVASIEMADLAGIDLPLRLHGTGARSLASLRLQGTLYERRLGADGSSIRPHALTLVEEPEAHLHPQAQFDLPSVLAAIPGQIVVSTHSTHLVSELEPDQLRILRPHPGGLNVVSIQAAAEPAAEMPRQLQPRLYPSEMEKLRRSVERPFGELLYASAVVLGDGATERALLPRLLRYVLGPIATGVCVIDPGSMGDPAAVGALKAARLLDVPWFIFADCDAAGNAAVSSLLAGLLPAAEHTRARQDHVVEVGGGAATEAMFAAFDVELCRAAATAARPGIDTSEVLDALTKVKGTIGRYLADELIGRYPDSERWPEPLRRLTDLIRAALSPLDAARGQEA